MATKIVTKNSSTSGSAPSASDLVQGELAVNVVDKRLYTEDNAGNIVELGTNPLSAVTMASTLGVTGVATLASLVATTADINGGTIDGTVIGGATPAAISGTTGAFSGAVTADGVLRSNAGDIDTALSTVLEFTNATYPLPVHKFQSSTSSASANNTLTLRVATGNSTDVEVARWTPTATQLKGDISFYEDTGSTAKFFWDASAESLGIGTSSPSQDLEILNGVTGAGIRLAATGTAYWDIERSASTGHLTFTDDGAGTVLTVGQDGNVGIGTSVLTSNSIVRELAVKSTATNGVSRYTLTTTDNGLGASISLSSYLDENALIFGLQTSYDEDGTAAPTERMRIDAGGNVLVGTTNVTPGIGDTDAGISMSAVNGIIISRANDAPINISRNSSDGALTYFRKDGAIVGSISTEGGDLCIGSSASGHKGVRFGSNYIAPINTSNAFEDATTDLGLTAVRFKDLRLSGGVYLGGTGAANKLDDYEEGTWTPAENNLTFTVAVGRYTKIGNLVHALGYVEMPTNTNGNTFNISLPFTSGDSSALYFTCSVTSTALADTAGLLGPAGSQYIAVINKDTEARTLLSAASGKVFRFNITYRTA